MKKMPFIAGWMLLVSSRMLLAQITIMETDVRTFFGGSNTFTTYTSVDVAPFAALAQQTGANQTFDFTNITYQEEETYVAEFIDCTPDLPGCTDPDFAQADMIVRGVYPGDTSLDPDSVSLAFGRLDSDGFYILGSATRAEIDETNPGLEEVVVKFSPELLSQKLPMTMGTSWEASSTIEGLAIDSLGLGFTIEETSEVEAWGQLVVPVVGTFDALKIRNRTITGFSFGGFTFADTSYTLSFVTRGLVSASIELDAAGNVLLGSYSVGAATGTGVDDAEIPATFALEQNYPNPFNPTTTIPFTLEKPGSVRLAVYDMLGKEAAVLVDEYRSAGDYTVDWRPLDMPSGSYLVKLSVDGADQMRMLTLLK